jgi:hypothetical protein
LREKIEKLTSNNFLIYTEKLNNIQQLIKELVGDKVQFIDGERYYNLINEVSTCILNDINECKASQMCTLSHDNTCGLIIPKHNLITKKLNSEIYFGKIADEIIRYTRIKGYMFESKKYLTLGDLNYNLNENEIIILQSLLNAEYFEKLIPTPVNKYVQHKSYDEVNPIITQTYDNKVTSLKPTMDNVCSKTKKKTSEGTWNCFPYNYVEFEYNNTHYCTFELIIDLIYKHTGIRKQLNEIKKELLDEYAKYFKEYSDKIIDILIHEGKSEGHKVKSEGLDFSIFILDDSYYLTTFDIWLLVVKYKIPTIFISAFSILQTNYKAFIAFGEKEDKFAFIHVSALSARNQKIPNLSIIEDDNNNCFIPIHNNIDNKCINYINDAFKNKIDIESYLINFKKPQSKPKPKPKIINSIINQLEIPTNTNPIISSVQPVEPIQTIQSIQTIQPIQSIQTIPTIIKKIKRSTVNNNNKMSITEDK